MNIKEILSGIGCFALGTVVLVASVCLAAVFIAGAAYVGSVLLPWLLLASFVAPGVCLVLFAPLCLFSRTRPWAGLGLSIASYLFGLTGWFMGLLLTWEIWGFFAVLIGLIFLGVGVVPIAVLATLFSGRWLELGGLVLLVILTFGFRILGFRLAESGKRVLSGALAVFALCAACTGAFGYHAYSYAVNPRPITPSFRKELVDVAVGVCAVLSASAAQGDPLVAASLPEAKARLRDEIESYDDNAVDEICNMVNGYLAVNSFLEGDMVRYLMSLDKGEVVQFTVSTRTRKAIESLPEGMRKSAALGLGQIDAAQKMLVEAFEVEDIERLPYGWQDDFAAFHDRMWEGFADTYEDLLGREMPSLKRLRQSVASTEE